MKLQLAIGLVFFGYIAEAGINPDWSLNINDASTDNQQEHHWVLQSKHPTNDITVKMTLVVVPHDKGLNSEWRLEYAFGPKAHHPSEMDSLDVHHNNHRVKHRTKISGRSVISTGLTAADIESFHDVLEAGTDYDEEERSLRIHYITPDTRDPKKKWRHMQGVNTTFAMSDWTRAYNQLREQLIAKGGESLLWTRKSLMAMPIHKLPAIPERPTKEWLQQAADLIGVSLDKVYLMSLDELQEERYWANESADDAPISNSSHHDTKKKMSASTVNALRNFSWPRERCQRPSLPRLGASESSLNRFKRNRRQWKDCLIQAIDDDSAAVDKLILKLGGSLNPRSLSKTCHCHDQIVQLISESSQRGKSYVAQTERLNDAVESWNSRQRSQRQQDEFWGGLNNALDKMNSDIEQLEQKRQQQWNSNIYTSPGYR